jgi:hypothetical protein
LQLHQSLSLKFGIVGIGNIQNLPKSPYQLDFSFLSAFLSTLLSTLVSALRSRI